MPSIFLSHSSKDKIFVRRLAKRLSKDGVHVWLDEADLKIGDSLIDRISEAIEQADYVGAVISYNSLTSSWVQKELSIAATKEIGAKKVVVVPILLDQCELPNFLKDKLYADFTDRKQFNKVYAKLLETLGRNPLLETINSNISDIRYHKPEIRFGLDGTREMAGAYFEVRRRMQIMIFWHDEGLTKTDALDLISLLADLGVQGILARHINPNVPDAVFISPDADQDLVRDVLGALPYEIKYIFPLNYPNYECGALSNYVMSVGLHSTHGQRERPASEEPKPIDTKALKILLDDALPKNVFEMMLRTIAGNE
jgi:hypothetical protein